MFSFDDLSSLDPAACGGQEMHSDALDWCIGDNTCDVKIRACLGGEDEKI